MNLCRSRSQRFSCNDSASNYFKEDAIFCSKSHAHEKTPAEIATNNVVKDENSLDYKGLRPSAASLVHHILVPRNGWLKSYQTHVYEPRRLIIYIVIFQ